MAPTITFIRHAQGFHNLSTANHVLRDPLLTDLGKEQCKKLSETFPYTSEIDGIVASPLKRTIYTAIYSFPSKAKGLGITALPDIQETSDLPCDTGSDKSEVEKEFADSGVKLDLSLLTDDWHSKKGRSAPERTAIEGRTKAAREWLKARKEKHIAVVTHGGVLHYLTEDWTDHAKFEGTGWANTEFRTYTFDPSTDAATLVETEESKKRRQPPKPLDEAETTNLKKTEGVEPKTLSKV